MSQQTHIERLSGRVSAAQARASQSFVQDEDGGATAAALPSAAPPWAVGSLVAGRFLLQQRLGQGRYGPIYKALDRSLSESVIGLEHHVALHELHPRVAARPTLLERLEHLPLQPQSWSHPNIVKLLELGRDGAKLFLTSELLDGVTLRAVLDRVAPEPLDREEAFGVLRAVGDALKYAHAKGIVHGDLRPERVFVTKDYAVKLLDLLPYNEPRRTAFFVDDPERRGAPHVSDDVYGLACLAYELLTGRHPYNGNSPLEALRAQLVPQPVSGLAPLRWEALSRGLALQRERRTASVVEVLAGLGVTGAETLRPAAEAQPEPSVPTPRWPEVTAAPAEPRRPAVLGAPRPVPPRLAPPDEEPWVALPTRDGRTRHAASSPRPSGVRATLGILLIAGLATLVYRDYAKIRLEASDLIETSAALAATELAALGEQWGPLAGTRTGSVGAEGLEAARSEAPPVETPAGQAMAAQDAMIAPIEAAAAEETAAAPVARQAAPGVITAATPRSPEPPVAVAAPASPTQFTFAERATTVSEGQVSAPIMIRRTGSLEAEAGVVWWTNDLTAIADEDYADLGARVETFGPGEASRTVHVPLIADSVGEQRESFFVNLRADRASTAAVARLEVIVLDDDL